MKYEIGKANRLGNRSSNQDRFAVIERPNAVLMVLADGMGGYQGGAIAAETVALKFTELFTKTAQPLKDPHRFFIEAIALANTAVRKFGSRQVPPSTPRSTVAACLIQNGSVWWAHAGDSRFYLFRHGNVIARTRDHSVVEELYQQGLITEKQRSTHPNRNQVTRCLGGTEKPPKVSLGPKIQLQPNDVILLCSDGLWNPLHDDEIGVFLFDEKNIMTSLDVMTEKAELRSYPKSDNISALALRWISNEETRPKSKLSPEVDEACNENEDPDELLVDQAIQEINEALEKVEEGLTSHPSSTAAT